MKNFAIDIWNKYISLVSISHEFDFCLHYLILKFSYYHIPLDKVN